MRRIWMLRACAVLLSLAMIAALVCAVVFSVLWVNDYRESSANEKVEKTRTAVVEAANQVLINSQSIDAANPDQYFVRLKSVLTEDALKAVDPQSSIDLIKQSGSKSTKVRAVIKNSAVSALDAGKGTASVLVFADVNATDNDKPVRSTRSGFLIDMQEVDGKWLGSAIKPLDSVPSSAEGGN